MMVMMMITVMMIEVVYEINTCRGFVTLIEAVYETKNVADSWHFLFLVDGHDADDADNSDDDGAW